MTESEILAAIEGLEPALQRAYLDQIRSVVDAATIAEVERLIEEQNTQGLDTLLALGAFALLIEAIRTAYIKGGRSEVIKAPGGRPIEFDPHSDQSQAWLKETAEALRKEIAEGQGDAIRTTVAAGINRGQSARETALDVVGRVSAQTGNRTGGVIGLTGNDALAVTRAMDQLLSGDPAQMKQYMTRIDRDKLLDGIVIEAIEANKPVSKADATRIVGAYADRKLKARAEMLARTETLRAYNAGWNQLYQDLARQPVAPVSIEKIWKSKGDMRVRHTHAAMTGQKVLLDQPFRSPKGALLMYPGDGSLGAGWDELANCRCTVSYRVKWK